MPRYVVVFPHLPDTGFRTEADSPEDALEFITTALALQPSEFTDNGTLILEYKESDHA